MKRPTVAVFISALILGLLTQSTAGQAATITPPILDAGNAAYIAAMRRGDAAAFAALFDEKAIEQGTGSPPVVGRDAIRKQYAAFFKVARLTRGTIRTCSLQGDEKYAVETGAFNFAFAGAKPFVLRGKYVTVWKRQRGGDWKIVLDAGQPDPKRR